MREERIRAIAGFPQGQVFDPELLEQSATRLRRAGVFRSVALAEADEPNPDGTLDVVTTLVEDLPRRYGFGGEVSTLDGVDASAFWMHRNLWGGAERLRFDANVENIGAQDNGIDYRFGVTLERPATFTPDTLVTLGAQVARLDDDDNTIIDLVTLGFGATQFVSERLTLRAGIEARAENVTDTTGEYDYRALAFPLNATMDARDDKFNPTRGYFLNAGLTPFVGFDETDSGARLTLDARGYKGVGVPSPRPTGRWSSRGGCRWARSMAQACRALRATTSSTRAVPIRCAATPISRWGERPVARTDHGRDALSGDLGRDPGAGYRNDRDRGFLRRGQRGRDAVHRRSAGGWQSGAGIGLRYMTGFGPLRVDLAVPVTGEDDDNGLQLYVGIGQSF